MDQLFLQVLDNLEVQVVLVVLMDQVVLVDQVVLADQEDP